MTLKIYPSVLNCDQMHFADSLESISTADGVHLDIMDNHFVPNLTWGLSTAQAVVASTALPVDAHLMIENPDHWAPLYAQAGCDSVCFHLEAARAPLRLAATLRELGAKPGIALNPATPVGMVSDVLGRFDLVTVMCVEPGFGGQGLIPECLEKVSALREIIDTQGLPTQILVDGGVNAQTAPQVIQHGADIVVAGSFVFHCAKPAEAIAQLRSLSKNS